MTRKIKRLTADDWERAALEAIAVGDLEAVSIEPLARRLGVTKGSFYSHFRDRGELVVAALRRWERAQVDGFAAAMERYDDPAERLAAIATLAIRDARSGTIQARLLLGSADRRVRAALGRVTEARLGLLASAFSDLGHAEADARRRALIAYAAYVGLLQLAREVPERLADEGALATALTHALSAD